MGITDEMISHNGKETCYRVVIHSFEHKMNTWKPGREVRCKTFWHDDIKFKLSVYPNGDTRESANFVSIYLLNQSNKVVRVNAEFKMHTEKRVWDDDKLEAFGGGLGYTEFFNHDRLPYLNVNDEDLAITVIIRKVWKEFDENDFSSQSLSTGMKNIQCSIPENINSQLQDGMLSVIDRLKSLETQVTTMQGQIASNQARGAAASANNWRSIPDADRGLMIPKPECPVCFDEMTTETRIAQCLSGHYLCWGCKANIQECPSCKLPVDGRAIGMEQYIKTLFK